MRHQCSTLNGLRACISLLISSQDVCGFVASQVGVIDNPARSGDPTRMTSSDEA